MSDLIVQRCPWWDDRDWERSDPDLKPVASAKFRYVPEPLADISPDNLYVLRGPRRVGKTVEVKRRIAALIADGIAPRRIIFVGCKGFATGDLRHAAAVGREQLTAQETEPRYWFFDEITEIKGKWPAVIADLRDNNPGFKSDCVVLSGSSSAEMIAATKLLAHRRGSTVRSSDRTLLPMGFRSFCEATKVSVPGVPPIRVEDMLDPATRDTFHALVPGLHRLNMAWERYLDIGGYPRAVDEHLTTTTVSRTFVDALLDVIAGDAIVGKRVAGRPEIMSLLTSLTLGLTNPVNLTALQSALGFASHHTVDDLVQRLITSYICWPCYQELKGRPFLGARHKVYFMDPLLARIPSTVNPAVSPPDSSMLSEMCLGITLVRQLERRSPGSIDRYDGVLYMTTLRKEIDFVGSSFPTFGYEGKYVDHGTKQEALTLLSKFKKGVLLTRSVFDLSDPVIEVPASFVAYLLDEPGLVR